MAKNSRRIVKDFLDAQCEDKSLAMQAYKALGPMLRIAETGEYQLADPSSLDTKDLCGAIAGATACICDRVDFVEVSRIGDVDLPGWETQADYVNHIHAALGACRLSVIVNEIGTDALLGIADMWEKACAKRVLVALAEATPAFGANVEVSLFRALLAAVVLPPVYLIALAKAGDAQGVADFDPLVQMLAKAIPIGETGHDLGTWYVLCA